MTLWAVPGFLGLASDWDHLQIEKLQGIDPLSFPWNSLEEWGAQFNSFLRNQKTTNRMLGYSMGGRLGLYALIDDPALWEYAIIVSGHPGFTVESEKQQRWENDKLWAARFLSEDWSSLMHAWNQLPVFKKETFHFKRDEKDFSRKKLADALLFGSQGLQEDLRKKVSLLPMPILYIVGENDERYLKLKNELSFRHPHSKIITIPHAAHRIPWSHPNEFKTAIEEWTCHRCD
jgi:2-succinyl-6-hydroxy-2,4-cyclohexadiene-1-carboxylate synthase